jgi:hypothetical protein
VGTVNRSVMFRQNPVARVGNDSVNISHPYQDSNEDLSSQDDSLSSKYNSLVDNKVWKNDIETSMTISKCLSKDLNSIKASRNLGGSIKSSSMDVIGSKQEPNRILYPTLKTSYSPHMRYRQSYGYALSQH